mmetsp:Transcript_64046/g.184063  ORF Transcript_64046/g.184063 Transcript_64046/m.184063 type:complete len:211 (-) Transcript_64046:635-1267(-)
MSWAMRSCAPGSTSAGARAPPPAAATPDPSRGAGSLQTSPRQSRQLQRMSQNRQLAAGRTTTCRSRPAERLRAAVGVGAARSRQSAKKRRQQAGFWRRLVRLRQPAEAPSIASPCSTSRRRATARAPSSRKRSSSSRWFWSVPARGRPWPNSAPMCGPSAGLSSPPSAETSRASPRSSWTRRRRGPRRWRRPRRGSTRGSRSEVEAVASS